MYNLDGSFYKTKKIPFRLNSFKILEGGCYLFSLSKENNKYQVLLTDSNFHIKKKMFPFTDNDKDDKITDNIFQSVGNTIIYNRPVNDSIYVFSINGELLNKYFFDFGNHTVPSELQCNYEKLAQERKSHNYIYFYDAPTITDNMLVGKIFFGAYKATLFYDLSSNNYLIKEHKPNETSYRNICFPVYADNTKIISWLDMSLYEYSKEKPVLNDFLIKHLEEGGRILCFHYLKQKH